MRSLRFWPLAALLLSFLACGQVRAAVSCSVAAIDSLSLNYDALATSDLLTSATFTVTCTRTATSDPTSVSFSAATNNGQFSTGQNNRAKQGTSNYLKYDVFTSSTYTTNWSTGPSKAITGAVTMGSSVPATASTVATYYAKVPFGQTSPQGTYLDTVTVSMTYGTSSTSAAPVSFNVQIFNVPTCRLSSPPGAISFTYSAFSPTAQTASTTFSALCSTSLPYTISLDSAGAVIAGLAYTLALSASSATGSGATQSYTINGTMAAGQAGTCSNASCTDSHTHTLTISY